MEHCAPADSGVSEGLALTSDSETEIFCDSVDSVEQLGNIKVQCSHTPQVEATRGVAAEHRHTARS